MIFAEVPHETSQVELKLPKPAVIGTDSAINGVVVSHDVLFDHFTVVGPLWLISRIRLPKFTFHNGNAGVVKVPMLFRLFGVNVPEVSLEVAWPERTLYVLTIQPSDSAARPTLVSLGMLSHLLYVLRGSVDREQII